LSYPLAKGQANTTAGGEASVGSLTEAQKDALVQLKDLHTQHVETEKAFQKELRTLKKKYANMYFPLYEKRCEVLASGKDPELQSATCIPNFWLTALKKHMMLADMVEAVDEPVLAYLRDIKASWLGEDEDDMELSGFRIIFCFDRNNPYFEPAELVKTYHMEAQPDETDPSLVSTDSTVIQWKPTKDITKKTITRKQKNKRTKQIRKLTETVSVPSFFNFFTKKDIPTEEELENMTEEQVEELEVLMEADYEAGVILRDKVIPHAVLWFTGEAVDSDMDMEDDGFEGEDEEDEEEEDEEEDEVDDGGGRVAHGSAPNSKGPPKSRRGPRRKKHGWNSAAKEEEPPNCKQQ